MHEILNDKIAVLKRADAGAEPAWAVFVELVTKFVIPDMQARVEQVGTPDRQNFEDRVALATMRKVLDGTILRGTIDAAEFSIEQVARRAIEERAEQARKEETERLTAR